MKLRFTFCVIIAMTSALTTFAQTSTPAQATPTPVPPTVVYEGNGKPMVVKSVTPDNKITVGFAKARTNVPKKSANALTVVTTATPTPTPAATTANPSLVQAAGSHWWDSPTFWLFFLFLILVGLVAWWLYTQQRRQEMEYRQQERWHEQELAEITTNRNRQPDAPAATPTGAPVTVNVTLTINGSGLPTIAAEAAAQPIASTPETAVTTTNSPNAETAAQSVETIVTDAAAQTGVQSAVATESEAK